MVKTRPVIAKTNRSAAVWCVWFMVFAFSISTAFNAGFYTNLCPTPTEPNITHEASGTTVQNLPGTIDVFIRSFYMDIGFLSFSLRSILKHSNGMFRKVIVVVPPSDEELFKPLLKRFDVENVVPVELHVSKFDTPSVKGYFAQMLDKYHADLFTDADYIVHIDSDTIFYESLTPEMFIENGLPILIYRDWNTSGSGKVWKGIAEQILNRTVPVDTMVQQGFIYPRWIYARARQIFNEVHKPMTMVDYCSKNECIEFNVLGGLLYMEYPENIASYILTDVKTTKPVLQKWSWGGLDPNTIAWLECTVEAGLSACPENSFKPRVHVSYSEVQKNDTKQVMAHSTGLKRQENR